MQKAKHPSFCIHVIHRKIVMKTCSSKNAGKRTYLASTTCAPQAGTHGPPGPPCWAVVHIAWHFHLLSVWILGTGVSTAPVMVGATTLQPRNVDQWEVPNGFLITSQSDFLQMFPSTNSRNVNLEPKEYGFSFGYFFWRGERCTSQFMEVESHFAD